MAIEVYLRWAAEAFVPADHDGVDQIDEVIRRGEIVKARITKPRNLRFHRKFFAMLKVGFEAWDPPPPEGFIHQDGRHVAKDFESFRKDCLALAGYADPVYRLDGSFTLQARSMSFASMDETTFRKVYSEVANVILQRVLTTYSEEDLEDHVQEILDFAW